MPNKVYAAARGNLKGNTLPPHWDSLSAEMKEVVTEVVTTITTIVNEQHKANTDAMNQFFGTMIQSVGLSEGPHTVNDIITAARALEVWPPAANDAGAPVEAAAAPEAPAVTVASETTAPSPVAAAAPETATPAA